MSTEHSAFAASGEDAITRSLEVRADTTTDHISPSDFEEFYDITRTAEDIIKGNYKRVALQFPDELLHVSVPIYRRLKAKIGEDRDLYVLADTSYGRHAPAVTVCCVDEVAAQHVDAHAVVHYGHACLTRTSRLPVIYVFGHKPLDMSACVDSIALFFQRHFSIIGEEDKTAKHNAILLKHDVGYTHLAGGLRSSIDEALASLGIKTLYEEIPTRTLPTETESNEPHELTTTSSSPAVLYIGSENLTLTNLLMTHGLSDVFSYNPSTNKTGLASGQTNRLLMRRYAAVQRARDADVFGILVGTLGVSSYLPLIRHIRALLGRRQKKSYTISVGKLNPSKLANFLEIECFVLVACPENSVIEAKEFLRPIVTPFELEVALQSTPNWTGRYVLNFEDLLAETTETSTASLSNDGAGNSSEDDDRDPDQPVFSLVTGTYRHTKRYGTVDTLKPDDSIGPDASVVLRNQDSAVAKLADSAAGVFLQSRGYQGLETRVGEDIPSVLEQGRSGIAKGYRDVDHSPPSRDS